MLSSIIELVNNLQQPPLYVPIICFTILLVIKWVAWYSPVTLKRRPPSPPKLPIIGNLHQVGLDAHCSLEKLSHRYGPLMLLHFGSRPVLIVSTPEAARSVMKENDLAFASKPKLTVSKKLLYDHKGVAAAPYSKHWRQMRKISVLHLLNARRVQSFRVAREEEVALFVKKISSSGFQPVNLSQMFGFLTIDLICRVAFGRKYSIGEEDGKKFQRLLAELMRLLGTFNIGTFIPWLGWINKVNGFDAKAEKTAKEFDRFLDGIVEEHIKSLQDKTFDPDHEDFVHVLLRLQNDDTSDYSFDTESMKALILDMFIGGSDTSSTTLEWTMAELIKNPRIMKELQNEVKNVAKKRGIITEAELEEMKYLKMVVKEGLRLHSPFPLLSPRETLHNVKVMGYEIDKGTMVLINARAIARDPNTWTRPDEFWPERFLNCSIDFRGHDFELIPFAAGRRGCPAISFAVPIMELVLANLVNNFNWELPVGATLDTAETFGLATHRVNPLLAVPIPM